MKAGMRVRAGYIGHACTDRNREEEQAGRAAVGVHVEGGPSEYVHLHG